MSNTYEFLKECGFYYLLTIDGEYPSGRPISGILEADGVMYFGTRIDKAFYQQLLSNPKVALIAFSKGRWLRLYAEVEETKDMSIREKYLNRLPMEIQRFGTAGNPALAVFALHVVKAEMHNGENKEDIDF